MFSADQAFRGRRDIQQARFLGIPGVNAHIIRDNGQEIPVSSVDGVLTIIVSDNDIRCYHSLEGKIKAVAHVMTLP